MSAAIPLLFPYVFGFIVIGYMHNKDKSFPRIASQAMKATYKEISQSSSYTYLKLQDGFVCPNIAQVIYATYFYETGIIQRFV